MYKRQDRGERGAHDHGGGHEHEHLHLLHIIRVSSDECRCCLLYTSDAADERSSVDLGGRRIIKKKKSIDNIACERR